MCLNMWEEEDRMLRGSGNLPVAPQSADKIKNPAATDNWKKSGPLTIGNIGMGHRGLLAGLGPDG